MITNPQLSKDNFKEKEKKNWSRVPDGGLTPGQTGRLTVGRKIKLTLTDFERLKPHVSTNAKIRICKPEKCACSLCAGVVLCCPKQTTGIQGFREQ
jgi:hypothetical protein